ncbi:bifunctional diaminohydroxyphosphoribosylaminopyrimidine deaminase/5-amino-6-(5-phosphoribosylamino)uracil reductase RibD [Aquabacterium sp.]|uniref:bifunctional diaminohydroxyphosphoribosylaminopyrimidine deaminase/5-amino-6-(5-phosphoribosylamino)uracil reductase RibD n=1 Tax=Aquabacterium sp. TaxID=1872578 RepID=UPI0035AF9FFA
MTPYADLTHMRRALELAQRSIGLSDPNPRVGCVMVTTDGRTIEGHTQQAGSAHAEAHAIQLAQAQGISLRDASAYVTLEPCSHFGRTPPCADALIAAGIRRVVVAAGDPNPLVAGQGIARLRAAGIEVITDLLSGEARELNIGFFSRMERGRPWVRLKVAASIDGHTALPDGTSQWITSTSARSDGQRWRARANGILTGIGTVLADDPRLDVREQPVRHQPLRVVLDSQWRTPPQARLLAAPGQALIVGATADAARQHALQSAGADVLALCGGDAHVDLPALLTELGRRGINELHVEAGASLNGALIRAGLVDEYLLYLAPKLLGSGRGMWATGTPASLAEAPTLRFTEVTQIGPDLRILARPTT